MITWSLSFQNPQGENVKNLGWITWNKMMLTVNERRKSGECITRINLAALEENFCYTKLWGFTR